ncbi:MAG: hypothetical protein FWG89_02420 [Treponema sp.]|nr:hypothetical protein [Treponema sp.]
MSLFSEVINFPVPIQEHHLNEKVHRFIPLLFAFFAGCLVTGLFIFGQRSAIAGRLDRRYTEQHSGAAATIERLEAELGRERELTGRLREHNNRARELAEGLADASERNVRNLSDAIVLVGEIRAKVKALADFYADWDTGSGDP